MLQSKITSQTMEDIGTTSTDLKHLPPPKKQQRGGKSGSPLPKELCASRWGHKCDRILQHFRRRCSRSWLEHLMDWEHLMEWEHLPTISSLLFPALADQLSGLAFIGACGWKGWKGILSTWFQQPWSPIWVVQLPSCLPKVSLALTIAGRRNMWLQSRGFGKHTPFEAPSHVCSTFETVSFSFKQNCFLKTHTRFPPWSHWGCESPSKLTIMYIAVFLVSGALTCQALSCTLIKQKLRTGTGLS